MLKRLVLLLGVSCWLLGLPVAAQPPLMPPSIVTFASDFTSVSLPDVESGNRTLTLSWQVVNLSEGFRLGLDQMQLNSWASLLAEGENLPPVGTRPVLMTHSLTFSPPTYRLSVWDGNGMLLDARFLTIPYAPPAAEQPPQIETFTTSAAGLFVGDLEKGQTQLNVSWKVLNRLPTANLIFEQVMTDGSTVLVEQPRLNLWINSTGSGTVLPISSAGEDHVRIRLRLVDVITGEIYDSMELPVPLSLVPVSDTAIVTVVPTFAPPPTFVPNSADLPSQIIRFSADPIPADPTGAVTLSWVVRGANSVTLQWLNKQGEDVVQENLPPEGVFSLPLANVQFGGAQTYPIALLPKNPDGQWIVDANSNIIAADVMIPLKTDLRVAAFTAQPNPVARDGQITLSWAVDHAVSVSILRVNPQGILTVDEALRDLHPASGALTIPVPEGHTNSITYLIGATDANDVRISDTSLTLNLVCPFATFIAPACPLNQQPVSLVYQPFESGGMFWNRSTREIYVLYANNSYAVFQDTWQEGESLTLMDTPPPGLFAPERGFGKVWANNPDVRISLGWASSPEQPYETTQETTVESFGRYPTTGLYFKFPDSKIVHLGGFPKTWDTP